MKTLLIFGLLAAIGMAQTSRQSQVAPDNTGRNANQSLTAQDQTETEADRAVTKSIRRSITKDDSISAMGKNIKVITRGGDTTLLGPVQSEEEKEAIGSIAESMVGKGKVNNQLEVKPPHSK